MARLTLHGLSGGGINYIYKNGVLNTDLLNVQHTIVDEFMYVNKDILFNFSSKLNGKIILIEIYNDNITESQFSVDKITSIGNTENVFISRNGPLYPHTSVYGFEYLTSIARISSTYTDNVNKPIKIKKIWYQQ